MVQRELAKVHLKPKGTVDSSELSGQSGRPSQYDVHGMIMDGWLWHVKLTGYDVSCVLVVPSLRTIYEEKERNCKFDLVANARYNR